jgi:hypothetical protein
MSVIPVTRQTRRSVTLSDGSVRFEVTTEIIDRGDLPFPHLFVVTINDNLDPKDDVLARIATPVDIRQADPSAPIYVKVVSTDLTRIGTDTFAKIASANDLTRLPRDRVTAQRAGLTQYLTTAVALLYDNVTTADAAAKQIVDRLSTLVTEWRSFNTNFATNPYQDYQLPQVGISVESQRIAVYTAAKNARLAAEAARDAAKLDKEACERDCAADKVIYDFLAYDVAFLEQADAAMTAITEGFAPPGPTLTLTGGTTLTPPGTYTIAATASTNAKSFALQSGIYGSDPRSYRALLVKKRSDLATYASRVRECTDRCATFAATLLTAQQNVDAATAAERAALAAVTAVCPTFDPSTV